MMQKRRRSPRSPRPFGVVHLRQAGILPACNVFFDDTTTLSYTLHPYEVTCRACLNTRYWRAIASTHVDANSPPITYQMLLDTWNMMEAQARPRPLRPL